MMGGKSFGKGWISGDLEAQLKSSGSSHFAMYTPEKTLPFVATEDGWLEDDMSFLWWVTFTGEQLVEGSVFQDWVRSFPVLLR